MCCHIGGSPEESDPYQPDKFLFVLRFGELYDEGRQNTLKQGSFIIKIVVESVFEHMCETIHRAFHVNTGVWVSLS